MSVSELRIKGSRAYTGLVDSALLRLQNKYKCPVGLDSMDINLMKVLDHDRNDGSFLYNAYMKKEGSILPYEENNSALIPEIALEFRNVGLDTLFLPIQLDQEVPIEKIIDFITYDTVYYTINNGIKRPTKAHNTDAGFDIFAAQNCTIPANMGRCVINSSVRMILPPNYTCDLRGRSGLASKGIIAHYGTVDADYRGMVGPILFNTTKEDYHIKQNDKVAQLVFLPLHGYSLPVRLVYLSEKDFSNHHSFCTIRAEKGFGSTGK